GLRSLAPPNETIQNGRAVGRVDAQEWVRRSVGPLIALIALIALTPTPPTRPRKRSPPHFSSLRSNLPAFFTSSCLSRNSRRFVRCSRSESRLRRKCSAAARGSCL